MIIIRWMVTFVDRECCAKERINHAAENVPAAASIGRPQEKVGYADATERD